MKVLCERLIETTAVETGLEYTMIRATNVLSPRSPYVRNLLDTFLRGPVPLIDEGSFSASFVHVENLVDGILLAADSPRAVNRAYNFCDDYTVTWREYMTQLGALVGKKPSTSLTLKAAKPLAIAAEVAAAPFRRRPLFSRYSLFIIGQTWHLSTARAREELGWSTRITWEQAWAEIEQFVTDTYPQARATTRTPPPGTSPDDYRKVAATAPRSPPPRRVVRLERRYQAQPSSPRPKRDPTSRHTSSACTSRQTSTPSGHLHHRQRCPAAPGGP